MSSRPWKQAAIALDLLQVRIGHLEYLRDCEHPTYRHDDLDAALDEYRALLASLRDAATETLLDLAPEVETPGQRDSGDESAPPTPPVMPPEKTAGYISEPWRTGA